MASRPSRPEWAVDVDHTGRRPPDAPCLIFTTSIEDVATASDGRKWLCSTRVDCFARDDRTNDRLWLCHHIHDSGEARQLGESGVVLQPLVTEKWSEPDGRVVWTPFSAGQQALHIRYTRTGVGGQKYGKVISNSATINNVKVPMVNPAAGTLDEAAIRAEIRAVERKRASKVLAEEKAEEAAAATKAAEKTD